MNFIEENLQTFVILEFRSQNITSGNKIVEPLFA